MPFDVRAFTLAKDPEHPEECQDAHAVDAASGMAVLADGVSSALFSKPWAEILTRSTLAEPPDPTDKDRFAAWLAQRRQEWSEQIDTTGLAWFQKAKLPTGAFSTLLWIRQLPLAESETGAFGASRLHGFAVGDTCLLHLRGGELVRTFPVQGSAEFQDNPVVLGSVNLNRDDFVEFQQLDEHCYDDDLLVLCTDAVAGWAIRRIEAGDPPNWDEFWIMGEGQWEDEIVRLRADGQMAYDDATLVLVRVVPQAVAEQAPVAEETPTVTEAPTMVEDVETVEVEPVSESPSQAPGEDPDWVEKFKSAGEQFTEGLDIASDQAIRGLRKWKDVAMKKYREKFKKDKK